MSARMNVSRISFGLLVSTALLLLAGCAMYDRMMGRSLQLSGSNEVPAVQTSASGTGRITVNDDRSVSGNVSVSGMKPTAAHIHQGGPSANGPVIIGLTKTSDTSFRVPDGAKLSEAQYNAYKAGDLYVNVHSAEHKGGEVRAQLKP